eukprot:TRINITY_DN27823_c0_g1_i1.p1 TRINITY_DN27823_c0_g1~~TRINITY_DN27823_c0_g1_i1.p1  ORF type:complete len:243 (+),score=55.18 TRINITY_DN27823_c0_g1_i1:112-840(+)
MSREEPMCLPVGNNQEVQAMVAVAQSPVVVIALHPWGPLGGSLNDPHPATVCRLFGKAGCSTVRFNFRSGIGTGNANVADVIAVAKWFTEPREGAEAPVAQKVLVAGYSYGSIIGAAAAADIPGCIGYMCLGPPLDYCWALYLFSGGAMQEKARASEGKPKLVLVGSQDQFCGVSSFNKFVSSLPEPKTSQVLEKCDHFEMYQHLPKLITEWILSAFGVADLSAFGRGEFEAPPAPAPAEAS